jgi:AcrR family transcriptional regulator
MPKAFTEHEKTLIASRLREHGYRLFSAYGLKKTNVEEIARAAGISKGAFYQFFESKEALFMEVVQAAEARLRQELLAVVALPGPSPRARLFAVLKKAFSLFESIPILRFFASSDFDLLFRRIAPETLQEHLANDRTFFFELIARCQQAGIPIRAQPDQILSLVYSIVLCTLHQEDWRRFAFPDRTELLLELVAAFCLGEIELKLQGTDDYAQGAGQGAPR